MREKEILPYETVNQEPCTHTGADKTKPQNDIHVPGPDCRRRQTDSQQL